ncbi:MAG: isomerizing glutamine--fructose-6-phosphate transaminase, partial [Erysipelotrichaceae bacterium]|nr:isomerizing glutamine--fructose-6-phosphate transaminase [Erysipelotrichaceae bacterium]
MCGIVAYVGYESIADRILIEGLKILEYRGYDSAGIASFIDQNIITVKTKGKVQQLEEKLQIQKIQTSIGIAHTRWATHGEPNEINAHPHHVGNVTLVHNGIIENYYELKEELMSKGYSFQSQSDSEIACAYIDYCYQRYHDKEEALIKAYQTLKGSFAFAILFADDDQNIYAMRKDSPLILGTSTTKTFIASDIQAFLHYTKQYIVLEHNEIARCSREGIVIKNLQKEFVKKEIQTAQMENKDLSKNGYAHYMLKEIHEQPYAIKETIQAYLSNHLKDLMDQFPDLKKFKQIHISACGSAMYAGMIAKVLIEKKARIPVQCIVASEYRYMDPIFQEATLLILISQSGET